MNSHELTAENLLASLPLVLQNDESMKALAASVAEVLAERVGEIHTVTIYSQIDKAPEGLLDILAHDLKVDWYGPDYPLTVRRNQVKNSVKVHRILGTKGAVATALSDIYPYSTVQEWPEYGGEPYHFRVLLDVKDQIVDIPHTEIEKAVEYYKSLRSRLDEIYYHSFAVIKLKCSTGYVLYSPRLCGTYPINQTEGGIADGGIQIDAASGGTAYAVRMCGSTPGAFL